MKTTPKFKKLAFAIGFTFSALFALAGNVPNPPAAKAESEKTIKDYFKFPQVLIQQPKTETWQQRKVEVLFTTEASGAVNFVLVKLDDDNLRKEIERQFAKLKLPQLKHDVVYSVVLSFRTV